MKRATILAILLTVLSAPVSAPAEDWDAWKPKLAEHVLRDLEGRTTTLEDLRGDVVVVNFWASWCKPCKKELRYLNDWNVELGERGAKIVAVSIDKDLKKAERFVKKSGLTLPVYHDGPDGLASALQLPSLPCTVVLDRSGNVVRVEKSGAADAIRELKGAVNSMIGSTHRAERTAG